MVIRDHALPAAFSASGAWFTFLSKVNAIGPSSLCINIRMASSAPVAVLPFPQKAFFPVTKQPNL